MPSPLGHALAGIAAGWLVAPPPAGTARAATWRAAAFAGAAMAPDLDLLFGTHRGPTHGLGAAVITGMFVWALRGQLTRLTLGDTTPPGAGARSRLMLAFAVTLAYASHTLLDWLGSDTSAPIGIMALWPFSHDYYESQLHVFRAISRRYWLPEFWISNARALGKELALLLPLVALAVLLRRRQTRG